MERQILRKEILYKQVNKSPAASKSTVRPFCPICKQETKKTGQKENSQDK